METRRISETPFPSLLLAVFNSIVEVFIVCLAGYILARHGILDKRTQKQINRLNVSLFTPALLFSKVAFFLTPAKLKELWVIPIWFVIVTTASMLVGRILGSLFGLRQSQRSFVIAAAMFMNSNALPIALMQSLVLSVPDLMWGMDDSQDFMLGRALTYLTMYSTLGMVLRYSYGVKLLSRVDTHLTQAETIVDERTPLLGDNAIINSRSSSTLAQDIESHADNAIEPSKIADCPGPATPPNFIQSAATRRNTAFYNSFPNSPNDSRANLDGYNSISTTDAEDDDSLPTHTRSSHWLHRCWRQIVRVAVILNSFMTAPLWSALLSLLIACIHPLQHTMMNHMKPLNNAIATAGKCSVPTTLIVLGAYFYVPDDEATSSSKPFMQRIRDMRYIFRHKKALSPSNHSQENKTKPGETMTIFLGIISRMIITPALLFPFMAMATKYRWQDVFEDPVFIVINVLLVSSPPALTLAQITQAASGDAFERLISRTIFWSYCIFTPPLMILSVLLALFLAKF
ncbi:endoplasmic reticulum auxin efflux carrier [Phlegmacium glaucopus]|nr:endoplasmic reticulum auxin efflux carrier [Phlegmacium glaucopus]